MKQLKALCDAARTCGLDYVNGEFYIKEPIESEYPGYYFIPNYSNYVISKETLEVCKVTPSGLAKVNISLGGSDLVNGNYANVFVRHDANNVGKAVPRYRLVAFAFLPFKSKEATSVNHINGIKSDDRPENLEWCTYSDNINHAYNTGLRPEVRKISCWLSDDEGNVIKFKSVREMTTWMNIGYLAMLRLYKNNTKFNDRWKICFDVPPGSTGSMGNFQTSPLWVYDLVNDKLDNYPSISSAINSLGIAKNTIIHNRDLVLNAKTNRFAYLGYLFFKSEPNQETIDECRASNDEKNIYRYYRKYRINMKTGVPFLLRLKDQEKWDIGFNCDYDGDYIANKYGKKPSKIYSDYFRGELDESIVVSIPFGADRTRLNKIKDVS